MPRDEIILVEVTWIEKLATVDSGDSQLGRYVILEELAITRAAGLGADKRDWPPRQLPTARSKYRPRPKTVRRRRGSNLVAFPTMWA